MEFCSNNMINNFNILDYTSARMRGLRLWKN